MSDWRLHTPIGLFDILPEECEKKKRVENIINNVFVSMGYKEIETPSFEYYDVFSGDSGQISQENMFKFFDEKGRILTLRPDITTSIARMAATKMQEETLPIRLSYTGNVFRAEKTEGARQREFTQTGIELLGSDSPKADAEVIAAAIEALYAVGINDFRVEIGQVAFFNGLVEQAKLSAEDTEKLRERIDCKDSLGIKELTEKLNLDDEIKSLMIALPDLFGDLSVIDKADVFGLNDISKNALENIRSIYKLLESFGFSDVISIDLGMLQSIDYYTGSIFKCYTHGVGFPVCAGGRYNNLVSKFGKDLSAVGVAFGVNRILSALRKHENLEQDKFSYSVIFAENGLEKEAYSFAKTMRELGFCAVIYLDGDDKEKAEEYAKNIGAECLITVLENETVLVSDFSKGESFNMPLEDFFEDITRL